MRSKYRVVTTAAAVLLTHTLFSPPFTLAQPPVEEHVREDLLTSISGTRKLIKLGQRPPGNIREEDKTRHPTKLHVRLFQAQRPWLERYDLLSSNRSGLTAQHVEEAWPQAFHAPALRKLLTDKDPAVRGLAAEALGSLRLPEDVPGIAKLLSDKEQSIARLGRGTTISLPEFHFLEDEHALDRQQIWQACTVSQYANQALWFMTDKNLNQKTFDAWWERQPSDFKHSLWYWERRIHYELAKAVLYRHPPPGAYITDAWRAQYRLQEAARIEEVRSAIGAELASLPAEIEAKIRLLALNHYSSNLGSETDYPLLGRFNCQRLPAKRLLELLEHKNLWPDVDWNQQNYQTLVTEIVGQAEQFFEREHVARLRAIHAREIELSEPIHASFIVGISRLLPPAREGQLDDPETRDGMLLAGLQSDSRPDAHPYIVGELIRVGLPRHTDFLTAVFFNDHRRYPRTLRTRVLEELSAPPLTAAKRDALGALLLDPRFNPLWEALMKDTDEFNPYYAFKAVNAFATQQVLTDDHEQRLENRQTHVKALVEVKQIIRQTLITATSE